MMTKRSGSIFSRTQATTLQSARTIDGSVDYVIAAVGFIVILGWLPSDISPQTVWLHLEGAKPHPFHPTFKRFARPDVTEHLLAQNRVATQKPGFILAFKLPQEVATQFEASCFSNKHLKIGLEYSIGVGPEKMVSLPITRGMDAVTHGILTEAKLQLCVESLGLEPTNAEGRILRSLCAPPRVSAHLDQAITHNKQTALVVGWLENAEKGKLAYVPSDLCSPAIILEPVLTPRNDVSVHLLENERVPETNLHGFVTCLDIKRSARYRICHLKSTEELWSADFDIAARREPLVTAIEHVRRFTSESLSQSSEGFARVSRALIGSAPSTAPDVARVVDFFEVDAASQPIQTSIIVPFYGDAFYLLDHIMAQTRVPCGVEWIFVCDDPRLAPSMVETISNGRTYLRQPTRLIVMANNGGFAHANNVGARFAKGSQLLLMNSDVYCSNFDFLHVAAGELNQKGSVGCVGFSLQFEDGTIQHDGMTFEKSPVFNDLWACEHPNKGMPQFWTKHTVEYVGAVTAALMMVRAKDFSTQPLFDPSYIIGDFEDADLCLRLRKQGKSIALVRTPGIFHLERQSMKFTGNGEGRMAITHLNCLTFNDKWGKWLSANNAKPEKCDEAAHT